MSETASAYVRRIIRETERGLGHYPAHVAILTDKFDALLDEMKGPKLFPARPPKLARNEVKFEDVYVHRIGEIIHA